MCPSKAPVHSTETRQWTDACVRAEGGQCRYVTGCPRRTECAAASVQVPAPALALSPP